MQAITTREVTAPQVANYYVDAQGLLKDLEDLSRVGNLSLDVVHIYGHGGLGKTSLLAMYKWSCLRHGILAAQVNGAEVKDPLEFLKKLAMELRRLGIAMVAFEKSWKKYEKKQATLTEPAEHNQAAGMSVLNKAAEAAGNIAKLAPGPGNLIDAAVRGSASVAGAVHSWFTKEDLELYWNAQQRLADQFGKDLCKVASRQRVVLLLDTYDQASGMDDWLKNWSESLPSNVLLVIAGRHRPRREWYDATGLKSAREYELVPMKDNDLRSLVRRYSSSRGASFDQARTDTLVELAKGLPLNAALGVEAWISHREWRIDDIRGAVTPNVYRILRRGLQIHVAEALDAGSVVRWFNRETLRYLMDKPEAVGEAYDELTSMHSMILGREDGFALHDTVVDNVREYWRRTEPEHLQELHKKALDFYQRVVTRLKEDNAEPSRIQKIVLEILFQQHEITPSNWIGFFQKEFEEAMCLRRQYDFCHQLVNDARTYVSNTNIRTWLEYYQLRMAILGQREPTLARDALERMRNDQSIEPDLRARVLEFLATSGWYDKLEHASGTREAAEIYRELTLICDNQKNPTGQARAQILLGILRQRTEGRGGLHFSKALTLLKDIESPEAHELITWVQREMSVSLRMKGCFQESENMVLSSISCSKLHHLQLQQAHSLLNYGFLLVWTGRLCEAEQNFKECRWLFNLTPHAQMIESAWPIFGLGMVEQGRGHYDSATKLYDEAGEIWRGDLFGIPVCDTSRAELFVLQGLWNRAIEVLERSEVARQSNEDMFGLAWALRVRGYALLGKGEVSEACKMFIRGRAIMYEYQSRYGESSLALGLCQAYYIYEKYADYEAVAHEVEQLANGKDRYMEHLAEINLLRGLCAMSLARKPDCLVIEQVISCFTNALTYAVQHNVYLLDKMAGEIVGAFRNCRELIDAVRIHWSEVRIDERTAFEYEHERRNDEATDKNHLVSVSDRFAEAYGR